MWMFYVYPAWRKTPVGRALLTAAIDMARGDDCCAFLATIFPANKLLVNLFRKFDFVSQGGALARAL
jgi:L-amino acid N-acyltransferase YncA